MKPEIGISEKHLDKSIALLSVILADEMTLYIKTRKFHWNLDLEILSDFDLFFDLMLSTIV